MIADVEPARQPIREGGDVGSSAGRFLLISSTQFFPEGDEVDRDFLFHKGEHRPVDLAMHREVEVIGSQDLCRGKDRLFLEEDRPEDRVLRLHAVRKSPFQCDISGSHGAGLPRFQCRALARTSCRSSEGSGNVSGGW